MVFFYRHFTNIASGLPQSLKSFTLPARPPNLHRAVLCLVPGEDKRPPAECAVCRRNYAQIIIQCESDFEADGSVSETGEGEVEEGGSGMCLFIAAFRHSHGDNSVETQIGHVYVLALVLLQCVFGCHVCAHAHMHKGP